MVEHVCVQVIHFTISLIQTALEAALKENTSLAQEFKTFQTNYLDEKEKLMVNYESRLRMEATIRDYLQVIMNILITALLLLVTLS